MAQRAAHYDIRRISAACRIDAPASCVWPLLVEAKRLAAWNPLVIQAIGDVEAHAYLVLWFRLPGGTTRYTRLRFSKVEPGCEVAWTALPRRDAVIGYEHRIRIDPLGSGSIRLLQEAVFFGRLPAAPWTDVAARFKQGLLAMNAALRAEAETIGADRRERTARRAYGVSGMPPAVARRVAPVAGSIM